MADFTWGTGRRKTAVARVRIRPGAAGVFEVNGRAVDAYFSRAADVTTARQPLQAIRGGPFDVFVNVRGGGNTGQAGAIRHGLARALEAHNREWRGPLKAQGYLTRDPRVVERKKPGRPGARKRFQFSKR
jgi:small subunit ribosomal protein S9